MIPSQVYATTKITFLLILFIEKNFFAYFELFSISSNEWVDREFNEVKELKMPMVGDALAISE